MDEEKKDLPVVGADGVQEPVDPEAEQRKAEQEEREKKQKQKQDRSRRTVIYGAGGAYLIYLAVQMIRDLTKQTPAEWSGTEIAALVASVVFIAAGVLMDRAHRTLVQAGHGRKEEPYDGRGELKWIRQ